MPIFEFNDSLKVNISEIDAQHKKLVDLINTLHDAMKEGKAKEKLSTILSELVRYAEYHFETEEKYMTKYSYPELDKHQLEHVDFIKKVIDFQKDFESGKTMISLQVMNFLKEWLIKHIQGTDKKYGPFLNAKGIV